MTIDEQIKIIQAVKDGKRVDFRCRLNSYKGEWKTVSNQHYFNFDCHDYLIIEEAKLVPWTAKDVPIPICWVRLKYSTTIKDKWLIQQIGNDCVLVGVNEFITFLSLFSAYEHSTDGVNWKPCGKEVK